MTNVKWLRHAPFVIRTFGILSTFVHSSFVHFYDLIPMVALRLAMNRLSAGPSGSLVFSSM